MVEYIPAILGFVLIFTLIVFCLYVIFTLERSVDTTKGKQLQAELDAHSNEIQRLMHRCRALEDRLAEIKKRLNEKQDRIDLAEWSYVPREIRELPDELNEESDEEETPIDRYCRKVNEMAERIGKAYCDFMSKAIAERLKGENQ